MVSYGKKLDEGGSPAIGIDLGSTYTCVGVWQNSWVEIIANEQGSRKTPSFVAFRDGQQLVGDAATNQAAMNTKNTIYDLKRLIGRRFSDASVQSCLETWPFTVTPGPREKPLIIVTHGGEEKRFSAEEISAILMRRIKEIAEDYLKCRVRDCVITVPGIFSTAQRDATASAGRIAGLNILRIANEPSVASLAYAMHRQSLMEGGLSRLLIFDLGGGTLSVSVVAVEKSVVEVLALAGDSHLGGVNFDWRMVDHFVKEFRIKHAKDITGSSRAMRKLVTACERAKRSLSVSSKSAIDIDALFDGIDFYSTITRAQFQDINLDLFTRCLEPVERCIRDARVGKADINHVVLVGGSSRIPMIQELMQNFFDGRELCKSHVNPDEAVAFGAAALANMLTVGDRSQPDLVEVTPRSLGLEIAGGAMMAVIPQFTVIPVRHSVEFCTYVNYDTCVLLEVYEGEEPRAVDNELVTVYELCDLPPAPHGGLRIYVTFIVDARSYLTVEASSKDGTHIKCSARRPATPLYPIVTTS